MNHYTSKPEQAPTMILSFPVLGKHDSKSFKEKCVLCTRSELQASFHCRVDVIISGFERDAFADKMIINFWKFISKMKKISDSDVTKDQAKHFASDVRL